MTGSQFASALWAIVLLLTSAQLCGAAFARWRQPRVIGEIVGGLLLGPTVLGAIAPGLERSLFPAKGTTAMLLSFLAQVGVLLLLFTAGSESCAVRGSGQRRLITAMAIPGLVVPFAIGAMAMHLLPISGQRGAHAGSGAFLLVFATAMAVTSIPVISRIMADLGLLRTAFARAVLGVAIVEDVVLYVVLAIAVDLAVGAGGKPYGVPRALGLTPGSAADITYHVGVTLGLIGTLLLLSGQLSGLAGLLTRRFEGIAPVSRQVIFLLTVALICSVLGVEPFLGAFAAGVVVGQRSRRLSDTSSPRIEAGAAQQTIRRFGAAFFLPIYFATVGLGLNLRRGFSVGFFLSFVLLACLTKAASVYAGARLGGVQRAPALHYAVALNARGGPGIVLASTAYAAGIISESFYATLVLLAVLTSLLAGAWLTRVPVASLSGVAEPAAPITEAVRAA